MKKRKTLPKNQETNLVRVWLFVSLTRQYLANLELDSETNDYLQAYLDLIANRASGKYFTAAKWVRGFVVSHPDYKKYSVVDSKIDFDLLDLIRRITDGDESAPDLVGKKDFSL